MTDLREGVSPTAHAALDLLDVRREHLRQQDIGTALLNLDLSLDDAVHAPTAGRRREALLMTAVRALAAAETLEGANG